MPGLIYEILHQKWILWSVQVFCIRLCFYLATEFHFTRVKTLTPLADKFFAWITPWMTFFENWLNYFLAKVLLIESNVPLKKSKSLFECPLGLVSLKCVSAFSSTAFLIFKEYIFKRFQLPLHLYFIIPRKVLWNVKHPISGKSIPVCILVTYHQIVIFVSFSAFWPSW